MARMSSQESGKQSHGSKKENMSQSNSVGSPISNEAYNVITALQAKLEGLEAYRKYCKDGEGDLWQQLTQQELQSVQALVDELERMVKEDKFRLHEPGRADADKSAH
jgi:hypothetical protein